MNILKEMDYDIIHYDAGDVRNKSFVDAITSNNISSCNVLDMMRKKIRKLDVEEWLEEQRKKKTRGKEEFPFFFFLLPSLDFHQKAEIEK